MVDEITKEDQKKKVEEYVNNTKLKSERERQSDKSISGVFTGSYMIHPFTNEKNTNLDRRVCVSLTYGTGAVMAVPCGDQRDWDFYAHFGLDIINIFENIDVNEKANQEKDVIIVNSDFLNGLKSKTKQ